MAIIREVPGPRWGDVLPSWTGGTATPESYGERLVLTGSGKASIALVLAYFRSVGALRQKTDAVLMPLWLGYWVYNQVNEYARPVFAAADSARVVMPYHQYGFPQQMDRIMDYAESVGAVVIEDCAHSLWMEPTARPQRCDDNFRIFSYSKFFYCHALGGIMGGGAEFREFAMGHLNDADSSVTHFNNMVKLLHELYLSGCLPNRRLWDNLLSMSYALYGRGLRPSYGAIRLMKAKLASEIDCRRRRYAHFRDRFRALETERYLGTCDVAPYVIPLHLPEPKLDAVAARLRGEGFRTGIYNFDTNRNLLDPKFEKVVWLMLHSGISDADYERQLDLVANCV